MDDLKEDILKSNNVWIIKISTGTSGNNMYLFSGHSLKALERFLEDNYSATMERRMRIRRYKYLAHFEKYINPNQKILLNSVIIQNYINKPLLFDTFYKFDIRIYALLASTNPCVMFYKFVKVRICASKFEEFKLENPIDDEQNIEDEDDDEKVDINITNKQELSKHISNSTMSRANKEFDKKTSTINGRPTLCDYDGFVKFMYDISIKQRRFDLEWFETDEYKKKYMENELNIDDLERIIDMKCNKVLSAVYDAAKDQFDSDSKRYNRPCQFLLQGNDIMIDENGRFWILEVNQTPTMFKDHDMKIRNLMKQIVRESIDIVMEIRDLKLKGIKVDQNTALKSPKLWRKGLLKYDRTEKLKLNVLDIVDNMINEIDSFCV